MSGKSVFRESGYHMRCPKLFCVPDGDLENLAYCANEITREFNGDKVDVES